MWINTQAKGLAAKAIGLRVVGYNFETIQGKVYIAGITSRPEQLEDLINAVKTVKGVKEIVNYMLSFWGSGKIRVNPENRFYEQKNLQLDINKAKKRLKWYPTYSVKKGVQITTEWYLQVFKNKKDPFKVTNKQILEYMNENNWC